VSSYNELVPALEKLLQEEEGDLQSFYARVEALAGLDPEARNQLLNSVGTASR
jgi:predicted aminopeptidase